MLAALHTLHNTCSPLPHSLLLCVLPQPQVPDVEALRPLQRLHHQLQQSLQLATHLHTQLGSGGVAGQAIKLEMQVRPTRLPLH